MASSMEERKNEMGGEEDLSQEYPPHSFKSFIKERSSSTLDAEHCSEEDYSSDTLSFLEKHLYTSSWGKTFLCSLNITSLLRSPTEFKKPCDLILEASFCTMSETVLREKINEVVERVNRLGKEIKSYPPEAFSLINSNIEDFSLNPTFPLSDSWVFSNTLQQKEPEFCKRFSNGASDFIDHLQNLIRCYHRRRITVDLMGDDQGRRKRRMSQETCESSDVPEEYYEQLFVSFAKMCSVFAFTDSEEQSMRIKGYTVVSKADILLVDFSLATPKQRMLAVVEVKKPKRVQESDFKKKKRETRHKAPDCYTHYLNDEPELVGQHGGEMLLYSPCSIFNDNGVVGIIVHGTVVTFSWLKITHNQYKQISQRKIQTTAEIKYSREYNYLSEAGRIEVIKAIFMLSLIGKLKYEFPTDCDG